MPEQQPTPETPQRENYAHEGTILALLLDDDNQRPWATHELVLQIGDEIIVADAIANLRAAGLIHKTSDGFVFPSRAAIRAEELAL